MCFEIIVGVSQEKCYVLFNQPAKHRPASARLTPQGLSLLALVARAPWPLPVDKYLNYMYVRVQSNLKETCSFSFCRPAVNFE